MPFLSGTACLGFVIPLSPLIFSTTLSDVHVSQIIYISSYWTVAMTAQSRIYMSWSVYGGVLKLLVIMQ